MSKVGRLYLIGIRSDVLSRLLCLDLTMILLLHAILILATSASQVIEFSPVSSQMIPPLLLQCAWYFGPKCIIESCSAYLHCHDVLCRPSRTLPRKWLACTATFFQAISQLKITLELFNSQPAELQQNAFGPENGIRVWVFRWRFH